MYQYLITCILIKKLALNIKNMVNPLVMGNTTHISLKSLQAMREPLILTLVNNIDSQRLVGHGQQHIKV